MSNKAVNRRIILAERPRYIIPTANVFRMTEATMPEARDGQVLIRTVWLGVDSYLYSRLQRDSPFAAPVNIGDVMVGATVGRVEVSNHPDYKAGDIVHGFWGWQEYFVSDGSDIAKVDPEIPRATYMLGALGISGLAAYVAVNELVKLKAGETLAIGSALGGVGQIAGQLGKIKGARVVAGASGPKKCQYAMEELGYDICHDRTGRDFMAKATAEFAKAGIDAYIMLSGGKILDTALPYFRPNARVAVCGMMATYGLTSLPPGGDRTVLLLAEIMRRRLQVRGLITTDYLGTPLEAEFRKDMKGYILSGKVKPLEHIVKGLENAPSLMQGLFEGKNFGKAVIQVAD
ncbi:NADP-dependent oxidoreductase [Stenotrophobium rhamnosiphilum]|uniref:NADP-dependent oxidoreductase n=1 Tax=Stenotrophobium rhamnosiphilum TaxID=2029166 RepID=A0A2T5MIP9_9GAMM|nr:NADP-dependent oxidoreductase [Stenotrophobium rhamnosiphilum]PTU32438.1 NADP-dependent oxidoreductase [Stenotrophobium rhamnosiphilum]